MTLRGSRDTEGVGGVREEGGKNVNVLLMHEILGN